MFDGDTLSLPRISPRCAPSEATRLLREHGALIVEDAAESALVDQVRYQLEPWFDASLTGAGPFFGTKTKRFSGVFAKAPATAELAGDEFLVSVAEAILKGDESAPPRCDVIQLNLTHAIGILPGQRAQVLHRDEVMFPFAHDFEVMVNVMWALDPWTERNGATRIVPRSGAWERTRVPQKHEVLSAIAPAGSAIMWLGSTVHGGGANASASIRRGLAFSYSLGWLAQSEKLLLSTPPHVARALPRRVQRLIGYQIHRPNLGWIEENDPIDWLDGRFDELAAAQDNLTSAQEALIAWRLQQEDAA